MNVIELFGGLVVGLEFVVANGPRGRDTIGMADFAEVLLAQPE
jgi:hypothetical protein